MVHYYFGDKRGLDDALLERALARVLERVAQVRRFDDLPATIAQAFGARAVDPAAAGARGAVRGRALPRSASSSSYASADRAPRARRCSQAEIDAGRLRSDLDPKLAFVSLLGMMGFAFIARPVLEPVLGLRYDAAFLARFAEHTRRLFLEGVEA